MKLWRKQVGLLITVIYGLGVAALIAYRWPDVKGLPLNSLGDFAAGAASPIAFLWLVLGYFQQGDELAMNTKALHDQAEELRSSVRAQEALAAATREQNEIAVRHEKESLLRLKRSAQPVFDLEVIDAKGEPFDQLDLVVNVKNLGSECSNLYFSWRGDERNFGSEFVGKLARDDWQRFLMPFRGQETALSVAIYFAYADADGEPQTQSMRIECTWDDKAGEYLTMFQHPRWAPRD